MQYDQQVCSLEIAKKLRKLGVVQDSFFKWVNTYSTSPDKDSYWFVSQDGFGSGVIDWCSAFTVAELGEILKDKTKVLIPESNQGGMPEYNERLKKWERYTGKGGWVSTNTEADARAKLLIYLLENKLINL